MSQQLDGVPIWRRGATLFGVIAVHALLLLMLLRLAPQPPSLPPDPAQVLAVDLLPALDASPEPAKRAAQPKRAARVASSPAPERPPPETRVVRAPATSDAASAAWSQVIQLSNEDFAAADIGRMRANPAGSDMAGSQTGAENGSDEGVGTGPNGERLYNADWQRRPTRAELATYLPRDAPAVGWGLIACRTVEGNRVEDCVELGQSPPGSGLSRAVRQAAWQFRVKPPRIGGRPMVGAWVRIRIDYTQKEAG